MQSEVASNFNFLLRGNVLSLIFLGCKLKNDYFCKYDVLGGICTTMITLPPLMVRDEDKNEDR